MSILHKNSNSKPARMALENKPLLENYQMVRSLGKGTFGDVMKAESIKQKGKVVAVKRLRNTYDATTFERLREIIFYRNVPSHRNLIELYEMFQDTASLNAVLVVECMRGNLYEYLRYHRYRTKTGLDAAFVNQMITDVLQGTSHIHWHGFVHRDIKPENILFTGYRRSEFQLKLADFGLCRALPRGTKENTELRPWTGYVATRWYRSPEQLLDIKWHTPALDIWAISLILYEICNLSPLFPGTNTPNMLLQLMTALGMPGYKSNGGPCEYMRDSLEEMYTPTMPQATRSNMGEVGPATFFRFKEHNMFYNVIMEGLQWDPNRRPSANDMISNLQLMMCQKQVRKEDA